MPIIRDTRTIVSGVASVAKSGGAAITGAVTLTGGAGITLTEAGQDITIAASGAPIQAVQTTLNNAQILALPTSTLVLVPAQGLGTLIRFLGGWISKDFTGGAYGNNGATGMYFVYDTVTVFDQASIFANDGPTDSWLINTTIRQMDFIPFVVNDVANAVVVPNTSGGDLRNTNLGFTIDNSLGNFTGGNAANTLTVCAYYVVATP